MTPTSRVLVVIAVAAVVAMVVLFARRRPRTSVRPIVVEELAPGVYLFSSADCDACARARAQLTARAETFVETTWSDDPDTFAALGIDAVPSVVIVGDDGRGRWFRGGVPPAREIPRRHRRSE